MRPNVHVLLFGVSHKVLSFVSLLTRSFDRGLFCFSAARGLHHLQLNGRDLPRLEIGERGLDLKNSVAAFENHLIDQEKEIEC